MLRAIPCTLMRGGTSKGLYFHARDLPGDVAARNRVLLAAMGSPDVRQIDGMGGAHPLTSKVAVISARPYRRRCRLPLPAGCSRQGRGERQSELRQPACRRRTVGHRERPCQRDRRHHARAHPHAQHQWRRRRPRADARTASSNMKAMRASTACRARRRRSRSTSSTSPARAAARSSRPARARPHRRRRCHLHRQRHAGRHPERRRFRQDRRGNARRPRGRRSLKQRIEAIRLQLGPRMNLGDVAKETVPKMCLRHRLRAPAARYTRAHSSRTACMRPSASWARSASLPLAQLPARSPLACARISAGDGVARMDVEHPTGFFTVEIEIETARAAR